MVASAVIGLFDATIERLVALAVLMPIVASMGGNVNADGDSGRARWPCARLTGMPLPALFAASSPAVMNGILFAVLAAAISFLVS